MISDRLSPLQQLIINIAAFNGLWLLLVTQRSPIATGIALAWIALHFALFARPGEPRRVASVMLAGVIIDGALTKAGVYVFSPVVPWLPAWLFMLWAAFATTLEHSLSWSLKVPAIAAVLGAVAGPFSYFMGAQLGAVALPMGLWLTLPIIGCVWGGLMFTLADLYRRFNWLPR